jgi:hypothetical protein
MRTRMRVGKRLGIGVAALGAALWVAGVAIGASSGARAGTVSAARPTLGLRPEPQPAGLAMLGTGMLALAVGRQQRRRRA